MAHSKHRWSLDGVYVPTRKSTNVIVRWNCLVARCEMVVQRSIKVRKPISEARDATLRTYKNVLHPDWWPQ